MSCYTYQLALIKIFDYIFVFLCVDADMLLKDLKRRCELCVGPVAQNGQRGKPDEGRAIERRTLYSDSEGNARFSSCFLDVVKLRASSQTYIWETVVLHGPVAQNGQRRYYLVNISAASA
ncbi:MAG: hypothetical protein QXQ70_04340, partial [Candidatus Caldarchaeum sp.]